MQYSITELIENHAGIFITDRPINLKSFDFYDINTHFPIINLIENGGSVVGESEVLLLKRYSDSDALRYVTGYIQLEVGFPEKDVDSTVTIILSVDLVIRNANNDNYISKADVEGWSYLPDN